MNDFTQRLVAEILRDAYRYSPGLDPARPTTAGRPARGRRLHEACESARDLAERMASKAGFTRRHFEPELAAAQLARILDLSAGLSLTHELLVDERSRRALIDLLKLRVLGPYHAPLAVSAERYRAEQDRADRELRLAADTIAVSDPWFSPLSLYRVDPGTGEQITLHSHSVDIVSVFGLGQYSHPKVQVAPGDVVLDVGGCWGDTALYFASRVGPDGRVYTLEFDPENLAVLRANLGLNPALSARIEVIEQALWHSSGETLQFAPAGRSTAVLTAGAAPGAPGVSTITLDDLAERRGLQRLDFIKMDVEGAEPSVLGGAGDTLRRFAPKLAIAAYHRDDDLVTLPAELDALGLGYQLYLGSFSAVEEETVLFAEPRATSSRNST